MNPKAEKAIKEAYKTIEHITSNNKIEETCERRMYILAVISTLYTVELINTDEYITLLKEKTTKIQFP